MSGDKQFDPCPHKITQVVLRAGAIIRQLKGLPPENNVTVLYNEMAPLLGVAIAQMSSSDNNHLPAPWENRDQSGKFITPRKDCPLCGAKESVVLAPLCNGCADSEGGKYKSKWECIQCKQYKEKLEKPYSVIVEDMGIETPIGMKEDLGIKTWTDNGLQ